MNESEINETKLNWWDQTIPPEEDFKKPYELSDYVMEQITRGAKKQTKILADELNSFENNPGLLINGVSLKDMVSSGDVELPPILSLIFLVLKHAMKHEKPESDDLGESVVMYYSAILENMQLLRKENQGCIWWDPFLLKPQTK